MIELKAVRKTFGELAILNDISFSVTPGSRVSLIGPGGCGKSTILKILLGLMPPDGGSVTLMGLDMVKAKERDKRATLAKSASPFNKGHFLTS